MRSTSPRRLSCRPRLIELERRTTPTLYVSQQFEITQDNGNPGLDDGDIVRFATSLSPVSGLTYGTDAFGTLPAAIAKASTSDNAIVIGGETINTNGQVVIDRPVQFTGSTFYQNSMTQITTLNPGANVTYWLRVATGGSLALTGMTLDGQANTFTVGSAVSFEAGSSGGVIGTPGEQPGKVLFQNVSGIAVVSQSGNVTVAATTFRNVGGGVYFEGGANNILRSCDYKGPGPGLGSDDGVYVITGASAVISGNLIRDAGYAGIRFNASTSGGDVQAFGNQIYHNGTGILCTGPASATTTTTIQYNDLGSTDADYNTTGMSSSLFTLVVPNNWWGSSVGPTRKKNPTTGPVDPNPPLDGGPPNKGWGGSLQQYLGTGGGNAPGYNPVVTNLPGAITPYFFGAGPGGPPVVGFRDPLDSDNSNQFLAYDQSFTGGVRVAAKRVAATRLLLAAAPGPGGGPHVRLFTANGFDQGSFMAYEPEFRDGLFVALGDLNNDGVPEIVTGPDEGGGPRVRVFDGKTLTSIADFFAFDPSFRGGVRVAVGRVDGDAKPDIVVGAGPGGGSQVKVFQLDGTETQHFTAFEGTFTGGLFVAVADLDQGAWSFFNDPFQSEIVVGAGAGGSPRVQVFDQHGAVRKDFFAFDPTDRGGVTVGVGEAGGADAFIRPAEVLIGSGPGSPPRMIAYQALTWDVILDETVLDPTFLGGVAVSGLGELGASLIHFGGV